MDLFDTRRRTLDYISMGRYLKTLEKRLEPFFFAVGIFADLIIVIVAVAIGVAFVI